MAVEDHVTSMPELTNQVLDDNEAEDSKSQKVDSDVTCETTTNQIADASHDHVTQPHVSKRETQTPNKKRKRSLTVSSAPVSDLREKLFPSSRDDNFGTEFSQRHYTDGDASSFGMVSSFSEQDFADIFKASIPVLNIETVEEQDGDDDAIEGPAEDEKQASQRSSVEDLNDGDNSSFGEDVYKPGTPSSLESRVETPESIEPVVIPDNITPDKVSIMMSTIKNDVYLVSKCTVKQWRLLLLRNSFFKEASHLLKMWKASYVLYILLISEPLWAEGVFGYVKQYYLYAKQITFHLMCSKISMNIIISGFGFR